MEIDYKVAYNLLMEAQKELKEIDCKYCPHNEGGCGYYEKVNEQADTLLEDKDG